MMSELDPRNGVLCGGDDPQSGRGNFGGKHVPDKSNTLIGLVHAVACTRQGQTLDCKR